MKKTMPRTLLHVFALGICLALCLLFGCVLLVYTVPMQDISYDLSLWMNPAPWAGASWFWDGRLTKRLRFVP